MHESDRGRVSTAVDLATSFLHSLERRDVIGAMDLLAADATQVMPFAPAGFPSCVEGKTAISRLYERAMYDWVSVRFEVEETLSTECGRVAVLRYHGVVQRSEHGSYMNDYITCFREVDGVLHRITEYFNPTLLDDY